MAGSRRRRSAEREAEQFLRATFQGDLPGMQIAVGLSGGVDSVVLLHVLLKLAPRLRHVTSALHVNHGLSPNAAKWERFCRALCRRLDVPLVVKRVRVERRSGTGLEAAARDARRRALAAAPAEAIALAHHLDDQAETVLLNLLRGAGVAGAAGMRACSRMGEKTLIRPLLEIPRSAIRDYAAANGLEWIEDESNRDETLRRNFIRRQVGSLLATRYPRWRENLARAARHFGAAQADESALLREFLASEGLRAPSERKLLDMLRQLQSARQDARVAIPHDGTVLRVHRGRAVVDRGPAGQGFEPIAWSGRRQLEIPELGGVLRLARRRGQGIDPAMVAGRRLTIRAREGGERLQLDARRPHRTLKNLFQEAGVPEWERKRLPLLYAGEDLVWVAGLGVQVRFAAAASVTGLLPVWRDNP